MLSYSYKKLSENLIKRSSFHLGWIQLDMEKSKKPLITSEVCKKYSYLINRKLLETDDNFELSRFYFDLIEELRRDEKVGAEMILTDMGNGLVFMDELELIEKELKENARRYTQKPVRWGR